MGTGPPPPEYKAELPEFTEILDGSWKNWIRSECTLVVIFDRDERVIGKALIFHGEEGWMMATIRRVLGFAH
jgi:hypothetical protein